MSKEIDWSKAPEGATHWVGGIEPWHKHIDGVSWYWQESESKWRQLSIPAEQVEDEYRATIVELPPESWTGTGLPPVGTVCECQNDAFKWLQGVIVHVGIDRGSKISIMQCDDEILYGEAGEFRPIRTQAQIEAEERDKKVEAMVYDIARNTTGIDRKEAWCCATALYDAGYRKTEAGK